MPIILFPSIFGTTVLAGKKISNHYEKGLRQKSIKKTCDGFKLISSRLVSKDFTSKTKKNIKMMQPHVIYVNHSSSSAFKNIVTRNVNGQVYVMNYDFDPRDARAAPMPEGGKSSDQYLVDFSKLFTPGVDSDFVIKTEDGEEFKVHKTLLAMHSTVFEAMFSKDYAENQSNEVTITNYLPETVKEFVHYFYTGEVLSDENAVELFMLADLYQVEGLTKVAEDIIIRNVDKSNVAEVFYLGYLHSAERLTYKAYSFVKKLLPSKPLLEMLREPTKFVEFIREQVNP